MLLLCSIWIFSRVRWDELIEKAVATGLLIDRSFEFIQYFITKDMNDGCFIYIQSSVLLGTLLYFIYKNNTARFRDGVLSGNGVYLMLCPAKDFLSFYFTSGCAKIVVSENGNNYVYGFRDNTFKSLNIPVHGRLIKLRLPLEAKRDIIDLIGTKYHIIKNNCYTIYNKVFKKHGLKTSYVPNNIIANGKY